MAAAADDDGIVGGFGGLRMPPDRLPALVAAKPLAKEGEDGVSAHPGT
jgi:hypothetical protein